MTSQRLSLGMSDSNLQFRCARRQDAPVIVRLLANDPLGGTREIADGDEPPGAYWRAF